MAHEQLPQPKPTEHQTPEPKVDHSAQPDSLRVHPSEQKKAIAPNLLQPESPHKNLPPELKRSNPGPNADKPKEPSRFSFERSTQKDTDPNAPKLPGKLKESKKFTFEKPSEKDTDPNAPHPTAAPDPIPNAMMAAGVIGAIPPHSLDNFSPKDGSSFRDMVPKTGFPANHVSIDIPAPTFDNAQAYRTQQPPVQVASAALSSTQLAQHQPTAQPANHPKGRTRTSELAPGQSIGTWGRLMRPLIIQPQIERTFNTVEGATAYAQSLGQAAVITNQHNRFVINPLTDDPNFPNGRFSFKRESLSSPASRLRNLAGGLWAIVTQDGYRLRPQGLGSDMAFDDGQDLSQNYRGQREAFGPGLRDLKTKDRFLGQYERSMRDTAFTTLNVSEHEAQQKKQLFSGHALPPQEKGKIHQVSKELAALDQQIQAAETEAQKAQGHFAPTLVVDEVVGQNPEKWNAARARKAQLEAKRNQVLTQYPLLSRIDPAEFNRLDEAQQTAKLREACGGVLNDIQATRDNLIQGKINLWSLAPLVATTNEGLGIQPEQAEWVAQKVKSDRTWDTASKVGTAALSIGLAVGGTVLGGPLGTAMAWGAFGVGVGGAASETNQYLINQSATNTNLDPNKSVVPQDMKGHWGWVVASWVGAGLDFGAAVQATRMLKAGMEVDQAIKILSAQHKIPAEELKAAYRTAEKGASDPKTLEKLLKSAMPEKLAKQANGLLKTPRILEPAEFAQKFGSERADAVTNFTKGKDGVTRAEVFFRKGGNPLSMREEAVHLTQLAEGGNTAKKIGMLTEENLSKWPQMATEQRLDVYRAKVEVEIDAQQRLLKQFGEGDPKYVKQVQQNLENLQIRQAEVEAGVKNPKAVQDADWLKESQAPRLFSKDASVHTITNKFPNEPLNPEGKIFGEIKVVNGKITLPEYKASVPRQVDFVVTRDGRMILGKKHNTLANGESVLSAGQLKIDGSGRIRRIDNLSGHYRPTVEESSIVPRLLKDMGLDLEGVRLQLYEFTTNSQNLIINERRVVDEVLK
jgi:hypothetical protein